jgi:hypothetical protein
MLWIAVSATLILCFTLTDLAIADVLRYHTHYVAIVDARVEHIAVIDRPVVDTWQWLGQRKSPQESTVLLPAQEIRLMIERVSQLEGRNSRTDTPSPILFPGIQIDVINPFMDQQPPFKVGDWIRVRIRLVSPEPVFSVRDPQNQWWFYPPGNPEEISPPRFPFAGVEFLTSP